MSSDEDYHKERDALKFEFPHTYQGGAVEWLPGSPERDMPIQISWMSKKHLQNVIRQLKSERIFVQRRFRSNRYSSQAVEIDYMSLIDQKIDAMETALATKRNNHDE